MKEPTINERAQHLLRVLIERYISQGYPVGSRTLARDSGLDLSPATIRNAMADLEEIGLIKSPHTSSGRIPTALGYRLFIDTLLSTQPLHDSVLQHLQANLNHDFEKNGLIKAASDLLSGITKMAGVVTLPKHESHALRYIEFLPLKENRVLVVIVVNDDEVQNKVITTERSFTRSELQQAANYLNEHFSGKGVGAVKQFLISELKDTRKKVDEIMFSAIQIASSALNMHEIGDYVIAGETNLMNYSEMSNIDKLRQLFEAFNKKREILHLLNRVIDAEGVQIFIGEESGYTVFGDCSVVTAPYSVDGVVVGSLGIIGPTRMAYDKVIPIVDVTAKLLGEALNQ